MSSEARTSRARAGLLDVLRLGAHQAARIFHPRGFDSGAVTCRWAREAMQEDGGANLELAALGKHAELVGSRERSAEILAARPGPGGYVPGKLKVGAMSFLAPHALTIADGAAWERLRAFNERVLETGGLHPYAETFLGHVRAAFSQPVDDVDDVRAAMGRAMVPIVLGPEASAGAQIAGGTNPAEDIHALFGAVQSPVKRKLLGFRYRRIRRRLYELLGRLWDRAGAGEETLLALGKREAGSGDREALLEQVPHWMFTFTDSGTDLLAWTLALVASRPESLARVRAEIAGAGPLDRAESVTRLPYLHACLLETGRLFPPATKTFHRKATPAGTESEEIVHYFPLLQRDDRLSGAVHSFRPERWLDGGPDEAARASNLFLRGPRACPGQDLILFVCKAAAARLLGELRLASRSPTSGSLSLARDPLPVSFPASALAFTVPEKPP